MKLIEIIKIMSVYEEKRIKNWILILRIGVEKKFGWMKEEWVEEIENE